MEPILTLLEKGTFQPRLDNSQVKLHKMLDATRAAFYLPHFQSARKPAIFFVVHS